MAPPKDQGWKMIGRLGLYALVAALVFVVGLAGLFYLRLVGLPGWGVRYVLLLIWLVLLVLDLGVRYTRYAFGLPDYRSAATWLLASAWLPGISRLKLWDTNLKPNLLEKPNLIKTVGGPGLLTVASGLVALTESPDGTVRVLEKGDYTLARLERVKDVSKLSDFTDEIDRKSATTRDGVTVDVSGIRLRYRLYAGEGKLEESVRLKVYNHALDEKGEADWRRAVSGSVAGAITGVIADNLLDYSTAPGFARAGPSKAGLPQPPADADEDEPDAPALVPPSPPPNKIDPRKFIQDKIENDVKKKLRENLGADLLWWDIGHFGLPEKVVTQRMDTWQKTWEGNLEIMRARKEAARLRYRQAYERGRTEAQINLLIRVVKGLDRISAQSVLPANSSNVYIAGMLQLLDTLGKAAAQDIDQKPPST